jgi:hypothetical protein
MVLCEQCGKSINEENPLCRIHPEKNDNAIKTQLTARDLRVRIACLVLERRQKERRA